MSKIRRKKRVEVGFTLIELMIVLSVVSIVTLIWSSLYPTFHQMIFRYQVQGQMAQDLLEVYGFLGKDIHGSSGTRDRLTTIEGREFQKETGDLILAKVKSTVVYHEDAQGHLLRTEVELNGKVKSEITLTRFRTKFHQQTLGQEVKVSLKLSKPVLAHEARREQYLRFYLRRDAT